jgi:hypothetical protein
MKCEQCDDRSASNSVRYGHLCDECYGYYLIQKHEADTLEEALKAEEKNNNKWWEDFDKL